eukprot:1158806-Pelagomonas_calceolata.AAC.3
MSITDAWTAAVPTWQGAGWGNRGHHSLEGSKHEAAVAPPLRDLGLNTSVATTVVGLTWQGAG